MTAMSNASSPYTGWTRQTWEDLADRMLAAVRPYVDRVIHAHAKDAEVFPPERNRYGFFGRLGTREQNPWNMGWWRYRLPGSGEVDFRRYVDALYEGGFDGVLSVEHEDPIWGGTTEDERTVMKRLSRSGPQAAVALRT